MKKHFGLVLAALSILLGEKASSQCPDFDNQPPNIGAVLLQGCVTKDSVSGIFKHRYTISNSLVNTGCIKWLELDLSYPPNGEDLPSTGLIDYPNYVDRLGVFQAGTPRTVPVGIPRLPNYKGYTSAWHAGFTVDGTVMWASILKEYKVEPGARLDSILVTSYGLPGFRKVTIYPSYNPVPVDTVERSEADELAFDSLEATLQWHGLTVGPTAPPSQFSPLTFLSTP